MVDRAIEGLECDKVMFDHEMGGYMATRYLIEQGHRRIACLVNARRSNTGRNVLPATSVRCARLAADRRTFGV